MAVCIAILDRNSTPLKLMTNDPSKEVNFHYIVHTSLDVISERCSTSAPLVAVSVKSVETTRDQYLGTRASRLNLGARRRRRDTVSSGKARDLVPDPINGNGDPTRTSGTRTPRSSRPDARPSIGRRSGD